MPNNIENADDYFEFHQEKDEWFELSNDDKNSLLEKAETMINNFLDLRTGTKDLSIYEFAINEQAIFLITFDKERARLQREGVNIYKVDDLTFHMGQSVISPIAVEFLKKYTFKRLGEVL